MKPLSLNRNMKMRHVDACVLMFNMRLFHDFIISFSFLLSVQLHMETPDTINNFFIESYLNDEPNGQFLDSENYLSQNKWNQADDENAKKLEAVSTDFVMKDDDSTSDWNGDRRTGNNEVYIENNMQCKKNIWTENFVTNNLLQMKWYLNEPMKVNLKNKTVKFR